jgi:hypothetical protein
LQVDLLLGDVILLPPLIVKVPEVLKLFRVHKDIREEHLFPGLIVKEGVRDTLGTVLREASEVLHPLEDQLIALIHLPGLSEAAIMQLWGKDYSKRHLTQSGYLDASA